MSEEKKPYVVPQKTEEKKPAGPAYVFTFDNEDRDNMVLKIPLKQISEHPDAFGATCYLIGFLEVAKERAMQEVGRHKMKKAQKGNIIVPGKGANLTVVH